MFEMTPPKTIKCPRCSYIVIDDKDTNFCPCCGYQYLKNGNDDELYECIKNTVYHGLPPEHTPNND